MPAAVLSSKRTETKRRRGRRALGLPPSRLVFLFVFCGVTLAPLGRATVRGFLWVAPLFIALLAYKVKQLDNLGLRPALAA